MSVWRGLGMVAIAVGLSLVMAGVGCSKDDGSNDERDAEQSVADSGAPDAESSTGTDSGDAEMQTEMDAEPADVPVKCGDNVCAPAESCMDCAKDCGSCDDLYVVEGEHFDQGSKAGVLEASESKGTVKTRLQRASNMAAGKVAWNNTKALYTLRTKAGPHRLCLRLLAEQGSDPIEVSVSGAGKMGTTKPADSWEWVCEDYRVHSPVSEIAVNFWSGDAMIDKLVLQPKKVSEPTGKGPKASKTCENQACQVHESCKSCKECCKPTCGNGFCHPDETCASCAKDCGACGSVYNGICRTSADIRALPAKHWCMAPNSHPNQAEKKPKEWSDWDGMTSAKYQSYQRVQGFSALIGAWNSGVLDSKRQRLILFGGGHNDYGGNELIAFSLKNLDWTRIADPTANPNRAPKFKNPDGTPISRHTYAGLAYVEETDSFFALGGAPDSGPGGCGTPGTFMFDLAAREMAGAYKPSQWNLMSSQGEPDTKCEDNAIYDPGTKRVLYSNNRGWWAYDVVGDSWSQLNSRRGGKKATFTIADGREMVAVGGGIDGFYSYDLDSSKLDRKKVSTSGDKAIESESNPGVAYDAKADRVIAWAGGADVFVLDLDKKTWTKTSPGSGNAADPGGTSASGGVYGRWRYSDDLNVFVAIDSTTENVFLYRHSK